MGFLVRSRSIYHIYPILYDAAAPYRAGEGLCRVIPTLLEGDGALGPPLGPFCCDRVRPYPIHWITLMFESCHAWCGFPGLLCIIYPTINTIYPNR